MGGPLPLTGYLSVAGVSTFAAEKLVVLAQQHNRKIAFDGQQDVNVTKQDIEMQIQEKLLELVRILFI
jgi:hypothetical protein